MRVYVESYFVLELVFEQEQRASCDAILQLAKARDIQLVLSAYSVVEASTVLQRQESKRNSILGQLHGELREVARMHGYGSRVEAARGTMFS